MFHLCNIQFLFRTPDIIEPWTFDVYNIYFIYFEIVSFRLLHWKVIAYYYCWSTSVICIFYIKLYIFKMRKIFYHTHINRYLFILFRASISNFNAITKEDVIISHSRYLTLVVSNSLIVKGKKKIIQEIIKAIIHSNNSSKQNKKCIFNLFGVLFTCISIDLYK